jgi:ketosteroid isomerase-like protein
MSKSAHFATPQAAEAAFYAAFERADVEAMMQVWAEHETIICIHPDGPRLRGHREIRASWEQIFAPGARLKFILKDSCRTRDALLSIHMLKECIRVNGVPRGVMLVTNMYQFVNGSWRISLHHASPEPEIHAEVSETDTLH